MTELAEIRDLARAELANAQAITSAKNLVSSLTGEYLCPADEALTADQLIRQVENLDQQIDHLFDRWAEAGCSIFPTAGKSAEY